MSVVPADVNDRLYSGPAPSSVAKQAHQKVQGVLVTALGTLTKFTVAAFLVQEPVKPALRMNVALGLIDQLT